MKKIIHDLGTLKSYQEVIIENAEPGAYIATVAQDAITLIEKIEELLTEQAGDLE